VTSCVGKNCVTFADTQIGCKFCRCGDFIWYTRRRG